MKEGFAIGIDLGGTNLKVGVVDSSGRVAVSRSVPVGQDRSARGIVAQIIEEAARLRREAPGPVIALGCGVPGIVDFEKGIVYSSPNLPEWGDVPVRELLLKGTGLPVALDNDANMYALGECRFGAGRGHRNMVLLTLGTGIGGGIVLNGEVFHGDDGFAGEVGHLVVEPEGISCGCGGRGCWERYAASRGFQVHAERLEKKEREALLAAAGTDLAGLTPELMAKLAGSGNKIAIELWGTLGRYLGIGIATLLNILGVYTFVVGGGIARSMDLFAGSAKREALAHTYPRHEASLSIIRAALGDNAGIVGAATEALAMAK
ncbi:MAG: ROK family protein [Pseudomonadota bacterium]